MVTASHNEATEWPGVDVPGSVVFVLAMAGAGGFGKKKKKPSHETGLFTHTFRI